MYIVIFRPQAEKEYKKLSRSVQIQIRNKLKYYLSADNPLSFASYLKDSSLGTYRYRIGDYRVIFDVQDDKLIILTLGNRRDIYK